MAAVATKHTEAGVLLGRTDDLARLDELAAGARTRRGAAITIVGAPGVGKTALLQAVGPIGVRAIDVTAAESEVALPWTGLAALLAPGRSPIFVKLFGKQVACVERQRRLVLLHPAAPFRLGGAPLKLFGVNPQPARRA